MSECQSMSQWLTLVVRNVLRHRLRTSLTLVGLVVAILAFGVLQTVVKTWYAGVDGAVPSRLLTRNAISFALPLPQAYDKAHQRCRRRAARHLHELVRRHLQGSEEFLSRSLRSMPRAISICTPRSSFRTRCGAPSCATAAARS